MSGKDVLTKLKAGLASYRKATTALEQVDAVHRLREAADLIELQAISAARKDGATWASIGACYGLTKQGAQQRFRASLDADRA